MMRTAQEIAKIDSLIPKAWELAGEKVKETGVESEERPGALRGSNNGETYNHYFRSEFFRKIMDKLARAEGLR